MIKHRAKHKRGFTLVELSIVIVIIGFLIMGIVSGRQLVDSAKVYAAVSEINKYIAAAIIFNTQYDEIPGDYSGNAGLTVTNPGNGDGSIGVISDNGSGTGIHEGVEAWVHLAQSEILITTNGSCSTASCLPQPGVNIPKSKINDTSYLLYGPANAIYLSVGYADGSSDSENNKTSIPGKIAKGIDKKIDSGSDPAAGSVTAFGGTAVKRSASSSAANPETTYTDSSYYYLHAKVSV